MGARVPELKMTTQRLTLTLVVMVSAMPLEAQPPTDGGRQPTYQQPAIPSNSYDQGRQPVLQGAGTGGNLNIQSFPTTSGVGPVQTQPFSPNYPVLSPYLNLARSGNTPGSLAISYFNFVRPAEQATGSFIGRTPGQYSYQRFGQPVGVENEQDLAPASRPAGTPSGFMNTGGYFNRLGTIGAGARQPARPATAPTAGRR